MSMREVTKTECFHFFIGLLVLGSGQGPAAYGQPLFSMTVTAASGARQTLIAMGATEGVPRNYSKVPWDSRLEA